MLTAPHLLPRIAVAVVGLTAIGGAAGLLFKGPLEAFATRFVADWGGLGVAVGFFLSDAFAVPVPPDLFLALGYVGGMPVGALVAWGTGGSLAGGLTAYGLSRLLRTVPAVQRRLEARGEEARALLDRYGVTALAVGALTPLPYSLMAWTCAVLGMPLRTFVLVSLLRLVRVALYLGLVVAGVVAVG